MLLRDSLSFGLYFPRTNLWSLGTYQTRATLSFELIRGACLWSQPGFELGPFHVGGVSPLGFAVKLPNQICLGAFLNDRDCWRKCYVDSLVDGRFTIPLFFAVKWSGVDPRRWSPCTVRMQALISQPVTQWEPTNRLGRLATTIHHGTLPQGSSMCFRLIEGAV